ncbi:OmpA/MotB family protein [Rubellimicrobium rubrum]|nr:hypothetical protein [Rubellimicrobium rubrum]
MAEAIILVTFALLLLLSLWKVQGDEQREVYRPVEAMTPEELAAAARLQESGQLPFIDALVAGGSDFRSPETLPETQEAWRLIEDEGLRATVDQLLNLPSKAQEQIQSLLASTPPPQDLAAAQRLIAAGQVQGADALVSSGADLQAPEAAEMWRLIDQDELQRILKSSDQLPEDLQRDLADLVEIQDPNLLERVIRLTERAQATALDKLSDEEIGAAVRLADLDQITAVEQLVAEGADFREPETTPATRDNWRLLEAESERQLLDAAASIPDEAQADLARLLTNEGVQGVERLLEEVRQTSGEEVLERRLAGIGQRIADAEERARSLVGDLREELGTTVSNIGGTIEADGSIVLPDSVLFEQGSAQITPRMREFLGSACEPWLDVLMRANAPVAFAQIEGHASREWRNETSPDEAYLKNLALSQARSQAVLDTCLRIVRDNGIREWAHTHLAAVGYSSAHPVLQDGAEDPARSRRVVFSIGLDDRQLLREVAEDAAAGLSIAPSATGAR